MIDVLEKIRLLTEQLIEDTDMFVVNIKIKPINNVKVFLDADSGLSIGKCAIVNRKLNAILEAENLFPEGDYSLEVSSPGVDEPLKNMRQYKKNIGRNVLVTLAENVEKLGLLKEVTEEKIVLEIKQPKKKESIIEEILITDIVTIVVQISF